MKYEQYSYIIRSKYRSRIVAALDTEKTPSILAKRTKIHLPHVSRALKELTQYGIVQCLTKGVRKGKIYGLTKIGKILRNKLLENSS